MFLPKLFSNSRNKNSHQSANHNSLSVEALEDRMMLSTVEIFAAGATGLENLDLIVNDQVEQTFFNVGGDASTGDFVRLTFETEQTVTPDDITIGFFNDQFDPSIGLDTNLFVDRIAVDGVTIQAEDPSTFSSGIFRDGGLTGPGFFQTQFLNVNGTLSFPSGPTSTPGGFAGDRIEFEALGTTGQELVDVLVDGQTVASFQLVNAGVNTTFFFDSGDSSIDLDDIRLEFTNDLFDPSTGLDRNVLISEFRVIDGDSGFVSSASTSDGNVLNSGIFNNGQITQANGFGGFLAGNFNGENAFVEIAGGSGGGGTGSFSSDRIEISAFGTTGEEVIDLLVDGQVVTSFNLTTPNVGQTFVFTPGDTTIALEDIRIEFVNDQNINGVDRNVQILEYRVVDGDTGFVATASPFDSNVLNSGVFEPGTGLIERFGAGGFLAGDFNGNAFVEIV